MKRPARPPLAETAEDFLSSLETTLKPSTCSHYRLSLRLLHDWLDSKRLRLKTFNREQAVQWLAYLASRGTGTGSRLMIILYARGYLRALNEAGLLRAAADTLLRRADMPKLPVYLPRPFSHPRTAAHRPRLQVSETRSRCHAVAGTAAVDVEHRECVDVAQPALRLIEW